MRSFSIGPLFPGLGVRECFGFASMDAPWTQNEWCHDVFACDAMQSCSNLVSPPDDEVWGGFDRATKPPPRVSKTCDLTRASWLRMVTIMLILRQRKIVRLASVAFCIAALVVLSVMPALRIAASAGLAPCHQRLIASAIAAPHESGQSGRAEGHLVHDEHAVSGSHGEHATDDHGAPGKHDGHMKRAIPDCCLPGCGTLVSPVSILAMAPDFPAVRVVPVAMAMPAGIDPIGPERPPRTTDIVARAA